MNFFQQLLANGPIDMTMRIMSKNDEITINIMPGSKVSTTKPIIVTGTAAELDEGFFTTIAPGVKEITGLVSNLAEVKDQVKSDVDKKQAPKKATGGKAKPAVNKVKAKVKKAEPAAEGSLFDAGEPEEETDQEEVVEEKD